jgi:hypothetical protein
MDFNYIQRINGFSNLGSAFSTVLATDQPSVTTLTSIVHFLNSYVVSGQNIANNLVPKMASWDMSNVLHFDYMFYQAQLSNINITGISNWRLNKNLPSTFYLMSPGITSSFSNIDISNWNPIVSELDGAFSGGSFGTQNVIYPNITTWTLLPYVCANNAFTGNTLMNSILYDALLIKFESETTSRNCQWIDTKAIPTNSSAAARLSLCSTRGWSLSGNPSLANHCCPGGPNC